MLYYYTTRYEASVLYFTIQKRHRCFLMLVTCYAATSSHMNVVTWDPNQFWRFVCIIHIRKSRQ